MWNTAKARSSKIAFRAMRQGPPSGRPFAISAPKARSGPIVLYFAARKSICCGMEQSLSLRRARPSDLAAVDLLLSRSYPRLLAADYPPSTLVTALPLISRARPDLLSSRSYFVVEDAEGRIFGAGGWTAHSPAARGGKVQAGLGRFGPYVVHHKGKGEKDYRSLKAEDDVLMVGLSRAVELLAQPKRGRGGRTALKDLGTPDGADEAIQLFDGPYGLYVKQGKVNASLPEGTTADTITLEQAVELLAAKAAAGKSKGRKAAGTTAAKKPAAKKPAAKKAPATTKTGRLRASAVRVIRAADS
mgnify:CR=1 FL=1